MLALSADDNFAVDLGCGSGIMGLRFSCLGVETILIDTLPVHETLLKTLSLQNILRLKFVQQDARHLSHDQLPSRVGLLFSQRFVYYLKYSEALDLLKTLKAVMSLSARLFISASGRNSELGDGYGGSDDLKQRFSEFAPETAGKH